MDCCGGDGKSHGEGHGGKQEQESGGITWTQALAILLIIGFILSLLMRWGW
ncbi:TPA: hypothetical protein HA225_02310 [Candidatus Micrarchaeota archaeon]|nr:hypothetical protein [Candidatus Micrarchaeota archaeon]HIH30158.1 hypothetical protein [Candidatus Micrarchaeota archaeon]